MATENNPKSRRSMTLPQRYDAFLSLSEINEMISDLEKAFEQTENEHIQKVLDKLQKHKNETIRLEDLFREDELNEFWENPGKFPHAVRTWFILYRDKENEV